MTAIGTLCYLQEGHTDFIPVYCESVLSEERGG